MTTTKGGKSKYIMLILRISVVIFGIAFAAVWLNGEDRWAKLVDIFGQMNVWLFVGMVGIFALGQIIVGFRWWLLLRSQSIIIDWWAAVRLHFLGLFYNNFMPSSVGGDLVRAWYVTRHTEKKFEAALSVLVDRVIGLLSTLVIAGFFYWLFLRGKGLVLTSERQGSLLSSAAEYKWIILWAAVGLVAIFCGLLLHRAGRAMLKRAWLLIRVHGLAVILKLKEAAVVYSRMPATILAAFALTVTLQMMIITGFWVLGQNLGIEADLRYYYVFFTLTWVLGAVPVSIGGAVVVESLLAYLFIRFAGVQPEAALALALCQRVVWMATSLPGAFVHLFGAHLPKDFSIDY